jgi:hypothetical protein
MLLCLHSEGKCRTRVMKEKKEKKKQQQTEIKQ